MTEENELLAKKHLPAVKEELIKSNIDFDNCYFEDEVLWLKRKDITWSYGEYGQNVHTFVKQTSSGAIIQSKNYSNEDWTICRILQWYFEEFTHDNEYSVLLEQKLRNTEFFEKLVDLTVKWSYSEHSTPIKGVTRTEPYCIEINGEDYEVWLRDEEDLQKAIDETGTDEKTIRKAVRKCIKKEKEWLRTKGIKVDVFTDEFIHVEGDYFEFLLKKHGKSVAIKVITNDIDYQITAENQECLYYQLYYDYDREGGLV